MIQLLELLERNQLWLYGILAVIGLFLLWRLLRAQRILNRSPYGLERELAGTAMARSIVGLTMVVLVTVLVVINSQVITPNIPVIFDVDPTPIPVIPPTPAPTATNPVVIPGLMTATFEVDITATLPATGTPVPVGGANCSDRNATITSPLPGAVLAGNVVVQGTADIPNFAFYVMEISTLGDNWLVVYTGSVPIRNDVLGNWNASIQPPGNYAFRLAVFDANGSGPLPCTIPISIGQTEDN